MYCLPTATCDLMQHQIVVSDSLGRQGSKQSKTRKHTQKKKGNEKKRKRKTQLFQDRDKNRDMKFRECLNENNQRLLLFLADNSQ